jgi:pyrroloquinoline-quinone synthase
MRNAEILARIDAAIAEKNLLKHPFYQDWQAGKLSREALQLYAAQYYRHVEAFPKHLRVLAARTEGPLQELIRENVAEEESPTGSHPKLWRDFAAAVGVGEDDITCCPALPGTQAVVQTFREICGDRPVAEAVAALYAYEADKAHRAAWRGWLEEHASGGEEEILKTTNEALDALWGALDAVHCAHA